MLKGENDMTVRWFSLNPESGLKRPRWKNSPLKRSTQNKTLIHQCKVTSPPYGQHTIWLTSNHLPNHLELPPRPRTICTSLHRVAYFHLILKYFICFCSWRILSSLLLPSQLKYFGNGKNQICFFWHYYKFKFLIKI